MDEKDSEESVVMKITFDNRKTDEVKMTFYLEASKKSNTQITVIRTS